MPPPPSVLNQVVGGDPTDYGHLSPSIEPAPDWFTGETVKPAQPGFVPQFRGALKHYGDEAEKELQVNRALFALSPFLAGVLQAPGWFDMMGAPGAALGDTYGRAAGWTPEKRQQAANLGSILAQSADLGPFVGGTMGKPLPDFLKFLGPKLEKPAGSFAAKVAEAVAPKAEALPPWYRSSMGLDTPEYFASKQRSAEGDIAGGRDKETPELDELLDQLGLQRGPKETGPFPYRKGYTGKGLAGPVTASTDTIDLPVGRIRHLPGANDERPRPGSVKYDALKESIDKRGFTDEDPISISVNHRGDAFVTEGNNRLAHAARLNRPTIKAQVSWKNGAHTVDKGEWTPRHVAEMVNNVELEGGE